MFFGYLSKSYGGASPIVFGPRTLGRTWGTRPEWLLFVVLMLTLAPARLQRKPDQYRCSGETKLRHQEEDEPYVLEENRKSQIVIEK